MSPGLKTLLAAAIAASALTLSACGSSSSSSSTSTPPPAANAAVSLAGICPATVSIQTDWDPESDHSESYQLLAGSPNISYNTSSKTVTGDLMNQGKATGVKVQVRAGGPAIGFNEPAQQMFTDPSIYMGYVNTDDAVKYSANRPTLAVMAPREKWAQVLIFDPSTYNFKTIGDVGKSGAKVLYFAGATYMGYLTGTNQLTSKQIDSSYTGTPSQFVTANGKSVQQGFITAEPWQYQHVVKGWMKPVSTLSIADAGYPNYGETLSIKKTNLAKDTPCLKKLIPVIQQAQVDYAVNPGPANAIIVEAAKKYNNGWEYPAALASYAASAQVADGIIGNGPTKALGDIDPARVQKIIDLTAPIWPKQNPPVKVKSPLTAADLYTNQFIDPSITMPASAIAKAKAALASSASTPASTPATSN